MFLLQFYDKTVLFWFVLKASQTGRNPFYALPVCGDAACGGNHSKQGCATFLLVHLLITVPAPVLATELATHTSCICISAYNDS